MREGYNINKALSVAVRGVREGYESLSVAVRGVRE